MAKFITREMAKKSVLDQISQLIDKIDGEKTLKTVNKTSFEVKITANADSFELCTPGYGCDKLQREFNFTPLRRGDLCEFRYLKTGTRQYGVFVSPSKFATNERELNTPGMYLDGEAVNHLGINVLEDHQSAAKQVPDVVDHVGYHSHHSMRENQQKDIIELPLTEAQCKKCGETCIVANYEKTETFLCEDCFTVNQPLYSPITTDILEKVRNKIKSLKLQLDFSLHRFDINLDDRLVKVTREHFDGNKEDVYTFEEFLDASNTILKATVA